MTRESISQNTRSKIKFISEMNFAMLKRQQLLLSIRLYCAVSQRVVDFSTATVYLFILIAILFRMQG